MRDPNGARPDSDSRRGAAVEWDRRARGPLVRIDLRQVAVLEIPDPHRTVAGRERARADADRDLGDDLVRPGIDETDVVRVHDVETAPGTASENENRDQCGEGEGACGAERQPAAPCVLRPARGPHGLGVGANRGERRRQSVARRLIETDRPVEVLEPLLPEVEQRNVQILLLVLEQCLRRLGEENLSTVSGGADSRRAMHCKPV